MTTPAVKICGLTREQDVSAADAAGADFLGFVMAPSKRRITPEHAAQISAHVHAKRVAVTVNATDSEIDAIMSRFGPDFIQFHGDETPEHIHAIAKNHSVGTIKALPVRTRADLAGAQRFTACCDIILFDAKPPKGTDVRGGHGVALDWTVFEGTNLPPHWALAGGLTPDNVAQAIALTQASMVDVASGVESAPGLKDHAALRTFIQAAKGQH